MTGVVFTVDAKSWSEMTKAVLPHVSKDDSRPMLTCVHVVTDGAGALHIEACDSYSLIRATARQDAASGAYDFQVPGAAFLGFKPGRGTYVECGIDGTSVVLTDGHHDLVLETRDRYHDYVRLDNVVPGDREPTTDVLVNAARHLSKLSRLPKDAGTALGFTGQTCPFVFHHPGGKGSSFSYRGAVMPLRRRDEDIHDTGWVPLPTTVGGAEC